MLRDAVVLLARQSQAEVEGFFFSHFQDQHLRQQAAPEDRCSATRDLRDYASNRWKRGRTIWCVRIFVSQSGNSRFLASTILFLSHPFLFITGNCRQFFNSESH